MGKTRRKKGFTLIELLVVIAVIAVLMGILMPALSKARKQARGAGCMSQLKQWSLIWSMYTDNNESKFPTGKIPGNQNLGSNMPRGAWITTLHSGWEKHPGLLLCPSATKRSGEGNHGSFDKSYRMAEYIDFFDKEGEQDESSYGINCWAYNTSTILQGRAANSHWKTLFQVKNAGNVPLFLDSMWRGGGPQWGTDNKDIVPPEFNGQWRGAGYEMMHFAMDRHARGVNSLFMDFSIRKVKVKRLWELKWHKHYDTQQALKMSDTWWGDWLGKEGS